MNLRQAFAVAIKSVRKMRHLTQEDFDVVSSRTYLSAIERGLKSPTLDKVHELASVMKIHPASLILLAYAVSNDDGDAVIDAVVNETRGLITSLRTTQH